MVGSFAVAILGLTDAAVVPIRLAVLFAGLLVAAVGDWRTREVRDAVWIGMVVAGGALFVLVDGSVSWPLAGLSVLLIAFTLQHFVPWDRAFPHSPTLPLVVEVILYAVVVGVTVWAAFTLTPAPGAPFFALLGSVILARLLFEAGLLYGGADSKALMAVGVVLPVGIPPLLYSLPSTLSTGFLGDFPFAFTVLVDGALLALAVPLGIALHNLRRGDRRFPRMFLMYDLPTEELPRRYVWVRDPPQVSMEDAETTEEDDRIRARQARELLAQGVQRVGVTPQVPLVSAFLGGAILGILVGNLLFLFLYFV